MRSLFNGDLPKLIMFDLDGTLVDSVPDLTSAVNGVFRDMGLPEVEEANVRSWVGNGAEMLLRRALAHVLVDAEPAFFEQAFTRFLSAYGHCLTDKSKLYPGVLEALEELEKSNVAMGVITNKPIAFTLSMLSELGLSHFFSEVLGGDSLVRKKPDPLPLKTMMSRFGLQAKHVLMVGDSSNDIVAAKSAGCAVVAVSYGYNHGENIYEAGADKVISSLKELL